MGGWAKMAGGAAKGKAAQGAQGAKAAQGAKGAQGAQGSGRAQAPQDSGLAGYTSGAANAGSGGKKDAASMAEGGVAFKDFTGGNPLHYQTHVKSKKDTISRNKKINLHHRGK